MGHQPTINCPFYEKEGMCDHHASRHKVLFGFVIMRDYCVLTQNLTITLYFTAISVVRGFAIRRFFNYKNNKNDN